MLIARCSRLSIGARRKPSPNSLPKRLNLVEGRVVENLVSAAVEQRVNSVDAALPPRLCIGGWVGLCSANLGVEIRDKITERHVAPDRSRDFGLLEFIHADSPFPGSLS